MWLMLLKLLPFKVNFKSLLIFLVVFAVLLVVGLSYYHYNGLVKDLSKTKSEVAILGQTLELKERELRQASVVIDQWAESRDKLIKAIDTMNEINSIANQNLRRLENVFANHDLKELSLKHPKLVEDIINRGTNDSMFLLQCSSGLTDTRCPNTTKATTPDPGITEPANH